MAMPAILSWSSISPWCSRDSDRRQCRTGYCRNGKYKPLLLLNIMFILHCMTACVAARGSEEPGTASCSKLVQDFSLKYTKIAVAPQTHADKSKGFEEPFIFFLHVPRTAGKTYSTCFLSASTKPSARCMPGYDRYRYPQSPENCRYYVSHDDISFLDTLPENVKDNVVVVTQMRDPVKRVISAYEFGIEVAGRKIDTPDSQIEVLKNNMTTVNTYNVWPWRYIIPFAREFIRERLDAIIDRHGQHLPFERHIDPATNKTYFYDPKTNKTTWEMPPPKPALNAYDNELTMPLHEWIETPEVEELVHNGHTLQILGISNTSFWEEASDLRHCFKHDEKSREILLELAKEKMSQMLHVGMQDNLTESVSSLAASLGRVMASKVYKSIPLKAYFYDKKDNIPNVDMMVTFNLTSKGGKFISLSIRNARYLMHNLTMTSVNVRKELQKKEAQLRAWLEREEKWLDKIESQRNSSLYWKFRRNVWRPLQQQMKRLHAHSKHIILGTPMEDYEDTYDDQYQDDLLKASPLNDNITSLDKVVAELQKKSRDISMDYHDLKVIPAVAGVPFGPDVRAYVPFPDKSYEWSNKTLGAYFATCSGDAYMKGKKKRVKPFLHLRNHRNEGFSLGKNKNNNIQDHVISRIKELNAIDYKLLEYGKEIFEKTLEMQKREGLIESVPSAHRRNVKIRDEESDDLMEEHHTEL